MLNALLEGVGMVLLVNIFTGVLVTGSKSALPAYISEIINIDGGNAQLPGIINILIALFSINLIIRFGLLVFDGAMSAVLRRRIQEKIFSRFLFGDWSHMRNFRVGDAVGTNTQEAIIVCKYLTSVVSAVYFILGALVLSGLAIIVNFQISMVLVLIALPLALLGAGNIIGNVLLRFSVRRVYDGLRGIDTLIWALIFVAAVGMGPFAGILALAVPDIGSLAKLFSEALESADRRQVEAVRAAGANRILSVRLGLIPQVAPVMLSQILYNFESNARSSTVLGIVGAGGIGLALSDRIRINNWDEVAFIILLILAMVAAIDWASRRLRLKIIGTS